MEHDEFENSRNEQRPENKDTGETNLKLTLDTKAGALSVQAGEMPEHTQKQSLTDANGGQVDAANDAGSTFAGLPIESLICKPIIAAAQGQQELTAVYIDGIKKLGFDKDGNTNTLKFSYKRPVIKPDGGMDSQDCEVNAPLLSLVPLPAFTMDELTVDFNMEIKDMDMSDSKTHADVSSTVGYNSWFGLNASITGNVSADSEHKRQTDTTSTYKIHARAVQQPPSEGMAKLTSLFAQAMEPINNKSK